MLPRLARKREWRSCLLLALAFVLAGCGGASRMGELFSDQPAGDPAIQQAQAAPPVGADKKIALLLPLSAAGETRNIALALKQAAELGLEDAGGGVALLTKDTGGTAAGAQAAADQAMAEGAKLILGPLLADEVRAVKPGAQAHGVNVIAFSSMSAVAGQGTYLMSFLPEEEIANVVRFATSKGYHNIAALYPVSPYGAAVERSLGQAVAANGAAITGAGKYARVADAVVQPAAAIAASVTAEGSALLVPEGGDLLGRIGAALGDNGVDPRRVKILGTGLWDDPLTRTTPIAMGGWYAGVAPDLVLRFEQKYSARYGAKPPRLASLAYDAAVLAASLAQTGDYSAAAITTAQGFSAANGLFRFRDNGLIERGLAILQMGPGGPGVIAPAPTGF